ncbi:uncharacterized protein NFIA_034820 [Aspergillus fischeri NRRL 181]|uniref:Uncharacterized protein n=1 Tax=Neosartorya fischeri (strain ATCC 1020 / DSM 3700 / CBS 544.65 / FGSC A1164 / JCM 1740 / NRRL 181 / WB 181) TaxID=331117 RepID=A1CYU4_NEOFI|nr:uncharacterized protein NFIA_034820 [Aspergillus fischeri NRRL 181]EAW23914.1 hypothetical protein NFIA_034820 [Aspergillus fischeri NRRL 181]
MTETDQQALLQYKAHRPQTWAEPARKRRPGITFLQALWRFHYANQLSTGLGYWSEEAKNDAQEALEDDMQWKAYQRDIEENAGTDNDDKIDVGKFTSTRSFQLRISNEIPTDLTQGDISPEDPESSEHSESPEGPMSSRTRTKLTKGGPPTAPVENLPAVETMPDAETRSNDTRNDTDSTQGARSATAQTGNTTAGGLSFFSAAHPDSAKHVFARTKDEETVNMALVNFLDVMSYYCKKVRKLRWDLDRQNVTVTVGKATIVARTDGRLSKRAAPSDSQNFAIVEVKPFILRENPDKTLMQMGMEMVAWIGQSIHDGKEVSPYILISQHRQEVFVTFAKPGDGYKKYLEKNGPDSMTPEESDFLRLHCFGPFDIFDAKPIRTHHTPTSQQRLERAEAEGLRLQELVGDSDALYQEEVLKVEQKYKQALKAKDKEADTLKHQIKE